LHTIVCYGRLYIVYHSPLCLLIASCLIIAMSKTEAVEMTEIKYIAKVSTQGDAFITWIPKEFHEQARKMKGKQVLVTISDEWQKKV
jgi:hypothetical protein